MPMNLDMDRLVSIKALADVGTEAFDAPWVYSDFARTAAELCRAPMALITLADGDRIWPHTQVGIEAHGMPMEGSFCECAMTLRDRMLVVEDAKADDRFARHPLVEGEPGIRFCAGKRLETSDGTGLGSLCAFAPNPMRLDLVQLRAFTYLAEQVSHMLERSGSHTRAAMR